MHTAFIYARARAEHARRIAAAALIAAAAVTPAAAAGLTATDYAGPKPRPSYIGAQSDRSPTITAAQYHRELDRLSDTMANVQRGYLAGTISQREYEAAQVRHGEAVRALQARRSDGGSDGGMRDPNNCTRACN